MYRVWNMDGMKCTVVIPTYNRPNHLKRILSYYNQYGNGLPVLIADSSSEENKKLNRETVASFQSAFFMYLDKYDPSTNINYKILDALQQVSTKYCVLCADDDFITPNGIQESTDFLDINFDFASAYGKGEVFVLEITCRNEPQIQYLKHHSRSNIYFEARDRLINELANYEGTAYYAVRHTCFMIMIYDEAVKSTNGDLFAELMVVGLSAVYGKTKCLDTLFGVREDCTPLNYKGVQITLQDLKNNEDYLEKKQKFSDCLARHLSKQSSINLVESYRVVDEAIYAYAKKSDSLMPKINKLIIDLKLPNWLDHSIRQLYRNAILFFSPTDRAYARTSKYYCDSNQIHLHISSTAREVYDFNY